MRRLARSRLLAVTFLAEGAVLAAALLLARFFQMALFPLSASYLRDVSLGAAGAFPLFIMFRITLSEKAGVIPVFRSLRTTVIRDVRPMFSRAGLIDIVVIALLAGFAEELFFRGVIQARFGVAAGSVLFGLFHFITPAYVLVTIIVGFYLGLIYHISGSLLVPVLVHGFYDLAALMYLRYRIDEENEGG